MESLDSILARMKRITEELYLVRDELYRRSAHGDEGVPTVILDEESIDVTLAFKAAVDELRQFLWHFINEIARHQETNVNQAIRDFQFKRVLQLVKALAGADAAASNGKPLDVVVHEIVEAASVKAGSKPLHG